MTHPATTTCYRHPDRATGLSCTECGRPICAACSIDAAVGQRCPDCVARRGRQRIVDVRQASRVTAGATPVTMAVIGITVALFVPQFLQLPLAALLFDRLAMANFLVELGEWWRMLTVVLVHANLVHILFNMWALYNLGPQVERELGGARLLALYLSTAAAGSAFAFFFGDLRDVGVGASGAIFGLFGVWFASAVRRRNTAYGRYLLNQLGVILLLNAAIPFIFPQVSWQAHLGGLLSGFVLGHVWAMARGRARYAVHMASAGIVLAGSLLLTQIL